MTTKTAILTVRTSEYAITIYDDFSSQETANNEGIWCATGLDKKDYLKLLKIYHPDCSELPTELATKVAQTINAAKDGKVSPFKADWRGNWSDTWDAFINRYYQKTGVKRPTKDLLNDVPTEIWEFYGRSGFNQKADLFSFKASKTIDYSFVVVDVEIEAYPCSNGRNIHIKEQVVTLRRSALLKFDQIRWERGKKEIRANLNTILSFVTKKSLKERNFA